MLLVSFGWLGLGGAAVVAIVVGCRVVWLVGMVVSFLLLLLLLQVLPLVDPPAVNGCAANRLVYQALGRAAPHAFAAALDLYYFVERLKRCVL
jgi:hypothetical protein